MATNKKNRGPRPAKASRPAMIDAALKAAIRDSGLTHYSLGKAASVDPSVIDRFMLEPGEGERGGDMRLSTAARLAAALGLTLRPRN